MAVEIDVLQMVVPGEDHEAVAVAVLLQRARQGLRQPVLVHHHHVGRLRQRVEPGEQLLLGGGEQGLAVATLGEREDAARASGIAVPRLEGVGIARHPDAEDVLHRLAIRAPRAVQPSLVGEHDHPARRQPPHEQRRIVVAGHGDHRLLELFEAGHDHVRLGGAAVLAEVAGEEDRLPAELRNPKS